jgi:translin
MKVSKESYVLGLLDCIGELKRLMLDNIRKDQLKEANRIFNVMENLYLILYPFAIFDKIVKEARRKLDVNRSLVEESRAIITEEIRRNHFVKALTKK